VFAFVLSWLLKEAPLRKSVAADGVAEHFATPREAESLPELERILSTLALRGEPLARCTSVSADRAEVDLDPTELWLLSRLGEGAPVDLADARLTMAGESLRERGFLVDSRLADDGEIVYARVLEARRENLAELLDGWEPRAARRRSRDARPLRAPAGRRAAHRVLACDRCPEPARALNRATLARQLLLERSELSVLDAVAHLVGLQAQEPPDPYIGLWSRLADFRPEELSALLLDRRVVRIAVMRSTLHLVTADDCLALRPLMQPVLAAELARHREYAPALAGVDLDAVLAFGREFLAEPRNGPRASGCARGTVPRARARRARVRMPEPVSEWSRSRPRGLWARPAAS
jgi:hypothetical protein